MRILLLGYIGKYICEGAIMDVRKVIYDSLVKIQRQNEKERHDFFVKEAKELIEYYYANKNNFAHSSNTGLIEFVRPFFPPVEFNEMVEEGIFNES